MLLYGAYALLDGGRFEARHTIASPWPLAEPPAAHQNVPAVVERRALNSSSTCNATANLADETARNPKASPHPSHPSSVVSLTRSESALWDWAGLTARTVAGRGAPSHLTVSAPRRRVAERVRVHQRALRHVRGGMLGGAVPERVSATLRGRATAPGRRQVSSGKNRARRRDPPPRCRLGRPWQRY